ncbi:Subtilase family protein [Clostridium cavendishii DSM 21758]|uniref:Subtilase family protein n=1 Tax=Clostridium cavendishii DSM 21758 TaxID=1121302 RepID=A0A1M6GU02_9CLOT|nr:S8 family peptidase [Clostridium cavendishii]SHJ13407.1 Subtilase family protein [Clostridium cavendishii DSM 21758]
MLDVVYTIVDYKGDIVSEVKKIPNARVAIIDKNHAILAVLGDRDEVTDKLFDVIVYVNPNSLYTLCDISPIDASGASIFHNSFYLPLDGSGVIVGIIDVGIDYLNEEFINEDGTSKIISIWDQNIVSNKKPAGQFVGTEYTREEINAAIKAKSEGKNPYDIVPSRDQIGHGTSMASIIGARGVNPELTGVAPRCDLAMVKLGPSPEALRNSYGVYGDVPTYSNTVIFLAIKYLYDLSVRVKKPIVILIPLSGNEGGHDGLTVNERYIDEISKFKGITVVVPTGNQGNTDIHVSGRILKKGDTKNIELKISKDQKNINFQIWVNKPDKFSLSIISPSGEIIERIPPSLNKVNPIKFLYEETVINIKYDIPEVLNGDEKITIDARNIKEGIWIFKLIGELVVTGEYNAYLLQRELLAPDTKFLNPDPYRTLTIPSTSSYAISVGFYNQNNNSVVPESGKGYTRDNKVKPDLVAGGINAVTASIYSKSRVISGSSVAAAVVAGCTALLFQWGIVNGNDTALYATKVKTYLISGTIKLEETEYPNPNWGYGFINMKQLFDNIRFIFEESREEFFIGELFIRLPV